VAGILKKTKGGKMFSGNDSAELGEYLISLNEDFKNGRYESFPEGIEEYSRPALAGEIAGILNSL